MDQHLGATYSLSILIVVAFAIVFYRADPPPRKTDDAAPTVTRANEPPKRAVTAPPSVPTSPPEPLPIFAKQVEVAAKAPVVPQVTLREPVAIERPQAALRPASPPAVVGSKPNTEPLVRAVSRVQPVQRKSARSAFTTVDDRESLDDVAERIYGTSDATERLWKANRDQLPSIESPLRVGMLLRTP